MVGKPDKQTPIFSDEMEEIVFNPYWNVPNSIKMRGDRAIPAARRRLLRRRLGYVGAARHGLRIRGASGRDIDPDSIDWSRVDIRNYDLCQPPGPDNVLGTVKFVFPNKHDVYMHDTTQKNPVRADGARREPWLHAGAESATARAAPAASRPGLDPRRRSNRRSTARTITSSSRRKIPVYITYFTLKVNDDGSVSTYNDIYGHDSRMTAALNGKPMIYEDATVGDRQRRIAAGQWNQRRQRPAQA